MPCKLCCYVAAATAVSHHAHLHNVGQLALLVQCDLELARDGGLNAGAIKLRVTCGRTHPVVKLVQSVEVARKCNQTIALLYGVWGREWLVAQSRNSHTGVAHGRA